MEMPRDLGLEFEAERDGVVTIRAVDAGGEGEAVGLIVGDVIDGIDGLPGVTVEEKIVELCDDSRELRATVMRIRRGGVVMAVELFAAHDGAEASVMAWMRSLPAAADAAEPARTRGGAYRAGAHRCLADLRRCANTLWPAVLSEYAEAGSAVFREFRAGGQLSGGRRELQCVRLASRSRRDLTPLARFPARSAAMTLSAAQRHAKLARKARRREEQLKERARLTAQLPPFE
jgi:hypothetical protein